MRSNWPRGANASRGFRFASRLDPLMSQVIEQPHSAEPGMLGSEPPLVPEPSPLRELLTLALPTVLQMASYTLMQFIDTLMLARAMGPLAPTAASNAGSLSFAMIGFGTGILLVVNTLVSQ